MEILKSTEVNQSKSHIRCPRCDKELFQAISAEELILKCEKCHRRYLINMKDGSVSIKLLSKPKYEE